MGADGNNDPVTRHGPRNPVVHGDRNMVRIHEPCRAMRNRYAIAGELVVQHIDFIIQGLAQATVQVGYGYVLAGTVSPAIESLLPPACQVEDRLPQVLDGMVPVCTQTPPTRVFFSIISTDRPSFAA